jgi:uncharacterized membrane protein YhhN
MMMTTTTGISSSKFLAPEQTVPSWNCPVVDAHLPASGSATSVDAVVAFWTLLAVAVVASVIDWVAVARDDDRLEYAAKPAVLALLTAAAVVLPDSHTNLVDRKWWFIVALAFCLLGDVVLMLPSNRFVPGLLAFLIGHLLFIVGLLQPPSPQGTSPFAFSPTGLAVASVVAVAYGAIPATQLFRSLAREGSTELLAPVTVYLVTILTMAVLAANVGVPAAAVGAAFFVLSDTLLALNRFVRPLPFGNVAVHVTYHLAQGLLVLSLVN